MISCPPEELPSPGIGSSPAVSHSYVPNSNVFIGALQRLQERMVSLGHHIGHHSHAGRNANGPASDASGSGEAPPPEYQE